VWYLRDNFVYGREFLGDGDLDAQRLRWLDATANVRIHGTTKEQPRVRFERDERQALRPLAAHPYRSVLVASKRETKAPKALRPRPAVDVAVERRTLTTYDLAYDPAYESPYAVVSGVT